MVSPRLPGNPFEDAAQELRIANITPFIYYNQTLTASNYFRWQTVSVSVGHPRLLLPEGKRASKHKSSVTLEEKIH